jgi:hypothetical protein
MKVLCLYVVVCNLPAKALTTCIAAAGGGDSYPHHMLVNVPTSAFQASMVRNIYLSPSLRLVLLYTSKLLAHNFNARNVLAYFTFWTVHGKKII